MQLQVIIDDTEYPITFRETEKGSKWEGTLTYPDYWGLKVVITRTNGRLDFEKLDKRVDQERSQLLEQLSEYLDFEEIQEKQQEQDGLEATDDEPAEGETPERDKPYDPTKIRVDTKNFSIHLIHEMLTKYQTIDLSPDFQRNFVWNTGRKSQLIESILLGIPLPVFYFSQDREGVFHVVDGLQRLTSITDFLSNKFALSKLEYLSHLNGKYFEHEKRPSLEPRLLGRILQTNLICNIIDPSSPSQVKYDIFRRINTGGQPLNHQEIRNCLAYEQTRTLLKEMAHSEAFQEATLGGVKDTRMAAQELALRFAGFWMVYLMPNPEMRRKYNGDMIEFLDSTVEILNNMPREDLLQIKKDFIRSMENARFLFGEYAFRKVLPEHLVPGARRQYINKVLFLTWSLVLAELDPKAVKADSHLKEGALVEPVAKELGERQEYFSRVTQGTNAVKNIELAYETAKRILTHQRHSS